MRKSKKMGFFKRRRYLKEFEACKREREEEERKALEALFEANPFVKGVKLVDETMFYDTTWAIETRVGDVIKLVRRDMETIPKLCKALADVHSIDEIKALDERDKIYYD